MVITRTPPLPLPGLAPVNSSVALRRILSFFGGDSSAHLSFDSFARTISLREKGVSLISPSSSLSSHSFLPFVLLFLEDLRLSGLSPLSSPANTSPSLHLSGPSYKALYRIFIRGGDGGLVHQPCTSSSSFFSSLPPLRSFSL